MLPPTGPGHCRTLRPLALVALASLVLIAGASRLVAQPAGGADSPGVMAPEPAAPPRAVDRDLAGSGADAPASPVAEAPVPHPDRAPVLHPAAPAAAPEPAAGLSEPVESPAGDGLAPDGEFAGFGAGSLPHDLSPAGMFRAADRVVKGVLILLALASVLTWTVFVVKAVEVTLANRRVRRTLRILHGAGSLAEARAASRHERGPAACMVHLGAEEYARSHAAVARAGPTGLKERVASALARVLAQAGRRLQRGIGVLASIGSVAPFVGLFGTVWGIMNAFIGISRSQTTNLAVVAPGIAEALLATALGLVAAIPAVILYNLFARAVTGYRQNLADVAAGVERLVSRDLDFGRVPPAPDRASPR